MALAVARAGAWALLFGGWLGLGALAQGQSGPLALWPLAVWLLALGGLQPWAARCAARPWRLAAALVAGAMVMAGLLLSNVGVGVVALATLALLWAWQVLLLSQAVRWLRPTAPLPPRQVLMGAGAGVLLAWMLAGDAGAVRAQPAWTAALVAGASALSALALVAGVRRRAEPQGCRRALFDCALAWPTWRQWQQMHDWPWLAAALVMLPMMAGLPLLSSLCSGAGLPAALTAALHAAAMLGPAAVLPLLTPQARRHSSAAVTVAMVGGGLAPWLWPGATGWLVAMLLQSAAWSLAWCASQLLPADGGRVPRPAGGPGVAAACGVLLLLALGAASQGTSAWPWQALHAALGALAALGWLAGLLQRPVSARRPAC